MKKLKDCFQSMHIPEIRMRKTDKRIFSYPMCFFANIVQAERRAKGETMPRRILYYVNIIDYSITAQPAEDVFYRINSMC